MMILIAYHSMRNRALVKSMLRDAGYGRHEVVVAPDGRELLSRAKFDGPDLIVSDWCLPEMTGMSVLQSLRDAGNKTPFAFFVAEHTTERTEDMKSAATSAGAFAFVRNSYDAHELGTALKSVLGEPEAMANATRT